MPSTSFQKALEAGKRKLKHQEKVATVMGVHEKWRGLSQGRGSMRREGFGHWGNNPYYVLFLEDVLVWHIISMLCTFPSPSLALSVRTATLNCPLQTEVVNLPTSLALICRGGKEEKWGWNEIPSHYFEDLNTYHSRLVVLHHPESAILSREFSSQLTFKLSVQAPSSLRYIKNKVNFCCHLLFHVLQTFYRVGQNLRSLKLVFPKG